MHKHDLTFTFRKYATEQEIGDTKDHSKGKGNRKSLDGNALGPQIPLDPSTMTSHEIMVDAH